MKKITSIGPMLALNTYWVGLSFKWNALHPIILPALLLNYVPDAQKNTWLGALTFIGLILASVVQPLSGAISDGWVSRWGRRRPLIVLGTLFDFVFLAILAWGGGLVGIFVGYIGLQISSNLAHGPAQGLLPDRVAPEKVGQASGLKTFMDMAALIIASLAAGRLLDAQGKNPTLIILVLMGVMLVATAITVLGTQEEATSPRGTRSENKKLGGLSAIRGEISNIKAQFNIDFSANRAYWWLLGQRFAFLLGIYGIQTFAQYYLRDVLKVENPIKTTGDLLATLTVALVLLAVAGGWLADKFGAKKVLLAASLLTSVGFVLIWIAPTPSVLVLNGSVFGAGVGLFLTSSWALANKLAPRGEAGKYLGLTNLATAGAGALARLEGPAIDALNAAQPGHWYGYAGMFIFGVFCTLISAFLLNRVTIKSSDE